MDSGDPLAQVIGDMAPNHNFVISNHQSFLTLSITNKRKRRLHANVQPPPLQASG